MTFKTQEIFNEIKSLLINLEREIDYDNSGDNYDVNKFAEDFYAELLNKINPNWNLINLNSIKANYPAIDLGDTNVGVAIQVTSDNSKKKIQYTLDKFYEKKLENEYNTLYILMIKGKGNINNIKHLKNSGSLKWSKTQNIIDNTTILNWIRTDCMKFEQLVEIKRFIKTYLKKNDDLFSRIELKSIEEINKVKPFKGKDIQILTLNNLYDRFLNKDASVNILFDELEQYKSTVDIVIINGNFISNNNLRYIKDDFLPTVALKLEIEEEQVILTIGNSEVDLNKSVEWMEKGLLTELTTTEKINKYISDTKKSNQIDSLAKIEEFKKFEENYYKDLDGIHKITHFESSHILSIKGLKIGINTFNPFILYSKNNDTKHQVLGKKQLSDGLYFIEDCDIKIGVSNLPPDYLAEFDEKDILSQITSYNLFITEQKTASNYQNQFIKNTFLTVSTDTSIINGIHYSKYNKQVKLHSHSVKQDLFTKNESIISFPSENDLCYEMDNKNYLEAVFNHYIEDIDKNLINYGTDSKAPTKIEGIFVNPMISDKPFSKDKNDELVYFEIEDIVNENSNILLHGRKESGKSLLLNRLLLEYYNNYNKHQKIPISIDFTELKSSHSVERIIVKKLSGNKQKIIDRLNDGNIVVLIDNIQFYDSNRYLLEKINKFCKEYSTVKVIATTIKQLNLLSYEEDIKNCSFKNLYIKDFNSKQIKTLAERWFSNNKNDVEHEKFLENIIRSFKSLGLPSTPMSISLYFWIIEKQEKKPINNSVLLKYFIENVLKLTTKDGVYRDRFDLENQSSLLADIAKYMYDTSEEENYVVRYGTLLNEVSDNLVLKGLNLKEHKEYDPQRILDNFINRGIFTRKDDNIKFRFECFFNYFLARKMMLDKKFKQQVLTEENFFSFKEEIDYFTGLTRNEEDVLDFLHKQMKKSFSKIVDNYTAKKIAQNIDSMFVEKVSIADKLNLEAITESRPTDEDIEEINDKVLENVKVRTDIQKKESNVIVKENSYELIKLLGKVLRNSENVMNIELKNNIYSDIVRNAAIILCQEKYKILNYYQKFGKMPDSIPWNITIGGLIKILPIIAQVEMYDFLGSYKLASIIYNKIKNDKINPNVSNIEKFMSVFTYADIKTHHYQDVLKDYIYDKELVKCNTISDLSFFKVMSYYYFRSKPETSNEEFFLDLMLEIRAKHNKKRKRMNKESFYKQMRKEKLN